jgi:hypothetical protein
MILRVRVFASIPRIGKSPLSLTRAHPLAALQLAFHLTELKRLIHTLEMHEALAAIDRAVDSLYEHSEFRGVSHALFSTAIEGKLTTGKEELLRQLGIRI